MEKRDNNFVLFKNDRKEQPNHADYRGTATVNGVEYYLDAWIKEGAKGKFMSGSLKPKKLPAQQGHQDSRADDNARDDDRIPF